MISESRRYSNGTRSLMAEKDGKRGGNSIKGGKTMFKNLLERLRDSQNNCQKGIFWIKLITILCSELVIYSSSNNYDVKTNLEQLMGALISLNHLTENGNTITNCYV